MSAVGMPRALLAYFAPRPYTKPLKIIPRHHSKSYSGLSVFLNYFESRTEPIVHESASETAAIQKNPELVVQNYDAFEKLESLTRVPGNTIIVARLSYETSEKKVVLAFSEYGEIATVRLIDDLNMRPRGYAFVEFKDPLSASKAVKHANGKLIDGKPILVDRVRARIDPGWLPRRCGKGSGPGRIAKKSKKLLKAIAVSQKKVISKERNNRPLRGRGGFRGASRGRPDRRFPDRRRT